MLRLLMVQMVWLSAACSQDGTAPGDGGLPSCGVGPCIVVVIDGDGTVAGDGIDCPGTCVAAYELGTSLSLRARPSSGSLFVGWSGDCRGSFHDCALQVNGPLAVTATFRPQRFNNVFVTSGAYPGALADSGGGDAICNQSAANASLSGNYRAWLSTTSANAGSLLGAARGFVRTDGSPLVDSQADLLAGHLLNAIRLDENGALVAAEVWTATSADGSVSGATCADWTVSSGSAAPPGESVGGPGRWTSSATAADCSDLKRLYCFMVDRQEPLEVAPPPAGAKQVFVSSAGFAPGMGLGVADSLCASDAATSGLPGKFFALLSTSSVPASARLTPGASYYRGTQPIGTGAEWTMNGPRTGIWQTADGGFVAAQVFTGSTAFTSAGTAASTCSDWMSMAGSAFAGAADTSDPDWWSLTNTYSCAMPGSVYCLQN